MLKDLTSKEKEPGSFPVDFCFQLTKEERDRLRSQIATFTERTRDRKYLPYVFAEDNWPREPRYAYGHINIVSSIITIRGVQVMLDSDIASLFQVGVKLLNQQRKRNPDRFPEDFCFQLTKEEILRSQFAITMQTKGIKGGRSYLPYVFAEDNWPREPRYAYGHINIVSSKITIRGVQVMLDSDIASLFQVGVKLMNQQMKRNPDRFPEDFCFQLTKEEILRSQFATSSSWGCHRYLPYVYTEQGNIALAGVFFILR